MHTQVFYIQYRKGSLLKNTHKLCYARGIGSGKDAFFNPAVHPGWPITANTVDQPDSALVKGAIDHTGQLAVIVQAYMLQHAHRHKHIVTAGDVAVVVLNEKYPIRHALAHRLLTGVLDLLPGDIVRGDLHAILGCHIACQAAPARPGLDHLHARLQHQLATHQFQLGELCLFQGHVGTLEIGTGILHGLPIQPELVEVIAQVIVVVDIVPSLADSRGAGRLVSPDGFQQPRTTVLELAQGKVDSLHKGTQITFNLYAPCSVQIPKVD